jgi:excisionase family DNA binding protein
MADLARTAFEGIVPVDFIAPQKEANGLKNTLLSGFGAKFALMTPSKSAGSTPSSGVEPRFLTLEDVATYLSVSVPQVYALVRSGSLPAIKIGGRGVWRVDREQLEAYVERLHNETATWAKEHPLNPRDG